MGELGEKAFVRQMLRRLQPDRRLLTGHGNDAAALDLGLGTGRIAFNIDRAAKPVAISHGWAGFRAWGRLAVTANCSDLLAAGAAPAAFMVSVSGPGSWPAAQVEEVILGCQEECERHGVVFAGGDTKEAPDAQVVGSAIGVFASSPPHTRTGAAPGHLLLLAGPVGGFLGAYLLLTRTTGATAEQRAAWIDYLAAPVPRWKEAAYIRRTMPVRAAMDTSDGLFDGFLELTRGLLGLHIDLDAVPFHPFAVRCSEQLGLPLENFLFGDGDWNVLYAVAPDELSAAALHAADAGTLRVIGEFSKQRRFVAHRGGVSFSFTGPRNEHFRSRLEDGRSFADVAAAATWFQPFHPAHPVGGCGEEVLIERGVR